MYKISSQYKPINGLNKTLEEIISGNQEYYIIYEYLAQVFNNSELFDLYYGYINKNYDKIKENCIIRAKRRK